MKCMKLLKIIVILLNLVRGVWKKKNDLKHCKWNFQIDTGFQIRTFPSPFHSVPIFSAPPPMDSACNRRGTAAFDSSLSFA